MSKGGLELHTRAGEFSHYMQGDASEAMGHRSRVRITCRCRDRSILLRIVERLSELATAEMKHVQRPQQ